MPFQLAVERGEVEMRTLTWAIRFVLHHLPATPMAAFRSDSAIDRSFALRAHRRHYSCGLIPVPAGPPLTILIADDHAVVRQGLRLLLETEPDLSVIGDASDLEQTRALLRERRPDVLVLDLHMGRELSLTTVSELRSVSPSTAVVVLTMDDDPAFVHPAWSAGAAGYVLKEASRTELVRAIRTVGRGGRYLDPAIGGWALSGAGDSVLSERELEVLRLLALGYTNTEIAEQMYISPRTVETHRARVQSKLGLNGRPQLVRYALEHGVIHR
jgi:two-component system response regulator NreC